MALTKTERRQRIKNRIRKIVNGTASRPRLAVYRSNKEIYAQIIDDVNGTTIGAASSRDKDIKGKGNKTEIAALVGKAIGEKAVKAGIDNKKAILLESTLLKFKNLAAVKVIPALLTPGINARI